MTADQNENSSLRPDDQLPDRDSERHPADDQAHSRHKVLRIVLWVLLLLVIVLVIFLFWHHHEEAEKVAAKAHQGPPGITITSATAQKGDINVYLEAIGTVTPVYTASITSQVNGQVIEVHYREGQIVRKGDPLIDIDPRPFRATLLAAQGALERDENVLAQAQMDVERYRESWARNGIAKQILDDQEKLVLQDKGTVKNDQGNVEFDQVQLDFCHITAPIAGRVGLRLVDPGNVVQSSGNTTLAVITQLQPITVVFTVPEDSLSQVQAGMRKKANLAIDAFDRTAQTKIDTGKLLTLDNQIDTTTGTVKGRAQFDNKNNALFPNQFVNTRLLVDTLQGVTLVPASAIQQNGQASFVYVIQDNVAHNRAVKPGVTEGGVTQVDGIDPGDVVANSSFDKLQENTKVVIQNNPPPANGSGSNANDGKSTDNGKSKGGKSHGGKSSGGNAP
jgi:membrane fusion protein, multidrug efflux system